MKVAEVAKLPEGTKLYLLQLDVCGLLGTVVARVIECEVRKHVYSLGVGAYRSYTYRGVQQWRSVRTKWLYREKYQADRELNNRLEALHDRIYTLRTTKYTTE